MIKYDCIDSSSIHPPLYLHHFGDHSAARKTRISWFCKHCSQISVTLQLGSPSQQWHQLQMLSIDLRFRHSLQYLQVLPSAQHVVTTGQESSTGGAPSVSKTWLQDWEEISTRKSGEFYDKKENITDRIYQATRAFNAGRAWPKTDRYKRVREQWDQFQLYTGVLNIIPAHKPVQDSMALTEDDGFEDDDSGFPETLPFVSTDEQEGTTDIHESAGKVEDPAPVQSQKEIDYLRQQLKDRHMNRLNEFLIDPKKGVQVYLSSYMRKQGFHYVDENLSLIPTLTRFYIKFLLKDEVFSVKSESEIIASFNQALAIVEIAQTELPLTSQISRCLPWHDMFSGGCEELFKVDNLNVHVPTWANQSNHNLALDVVDGQIDINSTAAATIASTPDSEEQEAEDDIVTPTIEHDLNERSVQESDASPSVSSFSATWGSDQDTLEIATDDVRKWDVGFDKGDTGASAGWGVIDSADISWGEDDLDTWEIPPPTTLLPILGPTALPLTHTSGVIEWSMRRIRSIVHPDAAAAATTQVSVISTSDGPSAEAVEVSLHACLSKVVMEPWIDWETQDEDGDTASPQIKANSRGLVVVYDEGQGVLYENDSDIRSNAFAVNDDGNTAQSPPVPHDPLKHSIVLLIEPENAQLLRVGMGLGATWIQIARQSDLRSELEVKDMETTGVVKAPSEACLDESNVVGERFWYLSNLLVVLPSYHIPSPY
ncbi:hypothetical protein LENED_007117 [Lentinula edodes]|uniref:Uncharacterized protein n=1 Tax=Lentinula edodes TaxID=5353 RepID=A0A1Q3EDI1_LENED|nr:hypothetical protein LENED_007117 [Lentinula edodes]